MPGCLAWFVEEITLLHVARLAFPYQHYCGEALVQRAGSGSSFMEGSLSMRNHFLDYSVMLRLGLPLCFYMYFCCLLQRRHECPLPCLSYVLVYLTLRYLTVALTTVVPQYDALVLCHP